MSKTMHSLVSRLLFASVQIIVIVAGFTPGWAAEDVSTKMDWHKAVADVLSYIGVPDITTVIPPKQSDTNAIESARNLPRPNFQLKITRLDDLLASLISGEQAPPGTAEQMIADCLSTNFSWVTRARIAAHRNGKFDQPLQDSLLNDLNWVASNMNLAKMEFAKGLYQNSVIPPNLLSQSIVGPDFVLRNQMLLTKNYKGLSLAEGPAIPPKPPPSIGKVIEALNKIDRNIEEWGRASISGFVLIDNITVNGGQGFFDLNYSQPTEFYMDQVRQNVQGAVATLVQKTVTGQLQVQFQNQASIAPSSPSSTNAPVSTNNAPAASSGAPAASTGAPTAANNPPGASTTAPIAANNPPGASTTAPTAAGNAPATPSSAPPTGTNAPATSTGTPAVTTNSSSLSTNGPVLSATNVGPNGYLSLLSQADAAPQLSENDVLKVGATDKETERVLNFMSDPINLPNNQRAYLCVMQVSISPGWRTKKGYVGEVQLTFTYGVSSDRSIQRLRKLNGEQLERGEGPVTTDNGVPITEAMLKSFNLPNDPLLRSLGYGGGAYPGVLSIFPFADAQALDFQSSLQKQLNLLLQMSASLQKVSAKLQAQLMASYQKLTRQDTASRNLLPLVVPSSRGPDVTYRFDPEFQALEDPGNPDSKAGQVLEPSSFPALIVIVCDEDEIMKYDQVVASTETRWLPAKHRNWWKHYTYDQLSIGALPGVPLDDKVRFETAANLDFISKNLVEIRDAYRDQPNVYKEAWRRLSTLQTFAVGRMDRTTLPSVTPLVAAVYPASFRRDFMPTNITVFCRYVSTEDDRFKLASVTLGGIVITNKYRMLDQHRLSLQMPANRKDLFQAGSYDLEVVNAEGPTILSNAVTVYAVPPPILTAVFPTNLQQAITAIPKIVASASDLSLSGILADVFNLPAFTVSLMEQGVPLTALLMPSAKPAAASAKPAAEKLVIDAQEVTIAGANLFVGDESLRVVIGGVALAAATNKTTNPSNSVRMERHDTYVKLALTSNSLAELKPGKYDVAVVTSGGEAVLSNALVITPKKNVIGPHDLALTSVHPSDGNLYSMTTISIVGSNFFGMWGRSNYPANPLILNSDYIAGTVTVGGIDCPFTFESPTNLTAYVPPRAKTYSTNEITMATNKLEVVVSGPRGVGVLSNAIAFDLLLPKDGETNLEKNTPAEQQSQKILDAVVLAERALGGASAERILTAVPVLWNVISTNSAADTVTRTVTGVGPKQGHWNDYELLERPSILKRPPDTHPGPGPNAPPPPNPPGSTN
jgi:hypothetical protein